MLWVGIQSAPTKLSLIVLSVGVLVYSMAHNIYHKQCCARPVYTILRFSNIDLNRSPLPIDKGFSCTHKVCGCYSVRFSCSLTSGES